MKDFGISNIFRKLNFILVILSQSGCGNLVGSTNSTACVLGGTCKIFITTGTYSGDLGGIQGADEICNSDLGRPRDGNTYKALLSDGISRVACTSANCAKGPKENTGWVVFPNTHYVDKNANLIVTSSPLGIWNNGALSNFLNSDHLSKKNTSLWTGLSSDFTASASNCNQWTSSSGSQSAATSSTDSEQIPQFGVSTPCSDISNALICVEQ